jgi:hypothetical protein
MPSKTATPGKTATPTSSIKTPTSKTTPSKDLYPSLEAFDTPSKVPAHEAREIKKTALGDTTPSKTNVVPPPITGLKTPTKSTGILKAFSPTSAKGSPASAFSIKFSSGLEGAGAKILEDLKARTAQKVEEMTAKGMFTSPKDALKKIVEKKKNGRYDEAHQKQFEKFVFLAF